MEESEARRAVEAGRATASALGLQVDDAVVVNNSDRMALRLVPCDVLARVAPSAQRADTEFEVAVARGLAEVRAPVAELDPRVEPRVHTRDDFAISLWTYYEPVGSDIAPVDYADALRRHHAALRMVDLEAPHVTERIADALAEVSDHRRTPELPGPDREFLVTLLGDMHTTIGGGDAGEQLLHGEPHPGNLLNTEKGPLFVDLATCCRGPVEFDLGHAPPDVGQHYPEADQDLIRRCHGLEWALFSTWRWRPDDQYPDREYWRVEGLNRVRSALDRT